MKFFFKIFFSSFFCRYRFRFLWLGFGVSFETNWLFFLTKRFINILFFFCWFFQLRVSFETEFYFFCSFIFNKTFLLTKLFVLFTGLSASLNFGVSFDFWNFLINKKQDLGGAIKWLKEKSINSGKIRERDTKKEEFEIYRLRTELIKI